MKKKWKLFFRRTVLCLAAFLMIGMTEDARGNSSTVSPQNVRIAEQSVTDSSFTVLWDNPEESSAVSDYRITVSDGQETKTYTAGESTSASARYIKAFIENGTGDLNENGALKEKAHRILFHACPADGLKADTAYTVAVQAVLSSGAVSDRVTVTEKTAAAADVVNVDDFGAAGDGYAADDSAGTESGGTIDTDAIQAAIDACPDGGTVLIPEGKTYLTGPVYLKSSMTLHVEGTLLGTADADAYGNAYDADQTKTGEKSTSLINALGNGHYVNIRVTGHGTIDGNGWCVAQDPDTCADCDGTFEQYEAGKASTVASAAQNHLAAAQALKYAAQGESKAYATRSNLLSFSHVKNLYLGDGLTVKNPSMHTVSISGCENVTVNSMTVSTYNCNNADGIDFSGSTGGFTVVNSVFNTGDDCICFSASSALSGNAKIFDNYFGKGHAALALGSDTENGIENVTAEDNVMNGTACGLRAKSQSGNGGGAWNIEFRNSALANMTDNDGIPFLITNQYGDKPGKKTNGEPCFHDISITGCTVNGAKNAFLSFTGSENSTEGTDYNISVSDLAFAYNGTSAKSAEENTCVLKNLKDCTFTDIRFYGITDPWDREDATLRNVTVK